MKHKIALITIAICSILLLISLVFSWPSKAVQASQVLAEDDCNKDRTVQVSGNAVVNVVPDRVLIQLGVESNATTVSAVQTVNTNAIKQVLAALSVLKIAAQDVSTDQYVIEPVYQDYNSLNIKGYRTNNRIAITLRDVSKTSDVIAKALEAGANQVINVDFYTSELRKYRDQARDLAIKAAQEKAQALAGGVGAQAGCALHINENTWSAYSGSWYGRNQNLSSQNVSQNVVPATGASTGAPGDDGPVSLGYISVQATVDVTFGLK